MSNLTDFFPSGGGGGGLTPKFQEFNSSGTFTPTQALIDAGGYVEVFLVAGGAAGGGAAGGDVLHRMFYLTSTSNISVTIGAGGGAGGGNSSFGSYVTAGGGWTSSGTNPYINNRLSPGWAAGYGTAESSSAGNGVFGYGAGAQHASGCGGVRTAKANSGQGSPNTGGGASGYCLIKWYE